MLKVTHLSKVYSIKKVQTKALNNVSVSFDDRGLVAILGPSGCGKTTLMNLIGGMDRDFEGEILLNTDSLSSMSDEQMDAYRKKRIGFIFQHAAVIQSLTVLENITTAMAIAGEPKEVQVQRARDLLTTFGLSGLESRRMNTLSGGQKQRVVIARALANNPDIILADEPTGELDSASSQTILQTLRQLANDRLVIMVTHEEKYALAIADRIIKMRDGQITSDEPHVASLSADQVTAQWKPVTKNQKGSKLKFVDAFKMALRALGVHRGRTFWTSFGTATGLIGIGLTLSITIGFSGFLKQQLFGNFSVTDIRVQRPTDDTGIEEFDSFVSPVEMDTFISEFPANSAGYVYHVWASRYLPNYSTMSLTVGGSVTDSFGFMTSPDLFFRPERVVDYLEMHDGSVAYPTLTSPLADNEIYLMINTTTIQSLNVRSFFCDIIPTLNMPCSFADIGAYFAAGNSLPLEFRSQMTEGQTATFNLDLDVVGLVISTSGLQQSPIAIGVSDPQWASKQLTSRGFTRMASPYPLTGNPRPLDFYQEARLAVYDDEPSVAFMDTALDIFLNQSIDFEQTWDLMNLDGTFDYYALRKATQDRILPEHLQEIVNNHPDELLTYVMDSNVTTRANFFGGGRTFATEFAIGVHQATNEDLLQDGSVSTLNPPYHILSYTTNFEAYNADKAQVSRTLYNIQGTLPSYTDRNQIVVSEALAREIEDNPADAINKTIYFSFKNGAEPNITITHIPMTIVGIARGSENISIIQDARWTNEFFTHYRDVSIFELYSSASFTLLPQSPAGVRELMDTYNEIYSEFLFVNEFLEILDVIDMVVQGVQLVLISLSSISLLVALLMVAIVTYISVVERTREVGILRAVGARKKDIRLLFLIESWGIGMYAAAIASGFVFLLALMINLLVNGLTSLITPGAEFDFIFIADMGPIPFVTVIGLAFVLTIVAGLYPSHRAASLDPIKALKKR